MDSRKGPEDTKRDRNIPVPAKKRQQLGPNAQQQSKSSSRGQDGRRPGKDERGNSIRPSSQDLARASFAGASPFGVRQQRSSGIKTASPLGINKKRNKKVPKQLLQPQDANPSTPMTHAEVVNEVENEDDDMEEFDIDCSPYDVHEGNDGEQDKDCEVQEQRDGGQSRGGFNSFQSGRSRRTVSPYPYRLKLKKQNDGNKWAVDETYDHWDEGNFFDDGRSGGADLMEDQLGDLNLQERYTVIDADHDNNLKPCLKKKANPDDQRNVMNVSWNENECDAATPADNEHEIEHGHKKLEEDNDQSCDLAEERTDEIHEVEASMQPQTKDDPTSQDSMERLMERCSFMIKTPVNSQYELDATTEGYAGEMQNHPVSDEVPGNDDANQCSEMDGPTKDGDTKGCSTMDNPKQPQSLVGEWTDDAISKLTDDEKYGLIKKQEHLEIARYDDPHLCRADRIKLLWEDCARKERLLHRLRPIHSKSLDGNGVVPKRGYNHYNY